jgi:integrase
MADNLEKQGGVYHVRMAIPKDVQSAFGNRRILSKSLGTSNRIEAMALRLPYLAKWKAEIKAHRAARQLPENWQDAFASQVALINQIKQHNKANTIGVPAPSLPFAPPPTISEMITSCLRVNGISEAPRAEQDRVASALHLEETMAATLNRALEAVWQNKYTFQPNQASELSTIIEDPSSYKPKSPITPAHLNTFKAFCAKQGLAAKSIDIQVSKLEALSTFLSAGGKPLDFDTVTAWLDNLPLAPKTLRQYIWAGNQFWKWATKYDPRWREDFKGKPNPFEGHIVRQPRAKEAADTRRKAFSVDQLAGLHAAAQEKKLSSLADLILLGSYTGARIEELCQLRVEDVVTVEGISALSITDSKTEAGIRTVPIHPTLSMLIERLKDQSEDGYLIPSTGRNKYGVRSDLYSKAFGRLKTQLEYGKDYVFHSIRKTFITELHRADVAGVTLAAIVGHETGTVTFDVYSTGPSMRQKYDAICKLKLSF